jgi:chromosome segregation ATPase
MGDGVSNGKEQAEIELIRAQVAKLERDNAPPPLSTKLIELVKVIGSLILGAGGVVAFITGYQMNEVKSARLELEYAQKQEALDELNKQYQLRQSDFDKLSEALKRLNTDLEQREKATALAAASVENTHQQLVALRDEVEKGGVRLSQDTSAKLRKAIDEAQHVRDVTKAGDAALATTKAEVLRLSEQQQQASQRLSATSKQALNAIRQVKPE